MTTKENPLTISSHPHVKYDNMAETRYCKTYVCIYSNFPSIYPPLQFSTYIYSIYSYVVGRLYRWHTAENFPTTNNISISSRGDHKSQTPTKHRVPYL